jgi:16S rRNA (uracil1498-N3)-methyltransferase
MKAGDRAVLFNGRGSEVTAEATEVARGEIHFRKVQEAKTPPLRCRITLAQAIPKGKNMDLIVQKAVEIGAAEIVPLISERTIVDLDPAAAAQKQAKWQQVAIEAAKQCGQNWLPQVRVPQKLKDFFASSVEPAATPASLSRNTAGTMPAASSSAASVAAGVSPAALDGSSHVTRHSSLSLIGSLQPDAKHLKTILTNYAANHGDRPTDVLILIGPEGDFTPAELALAKTHGCQPITLGPIILKVETASIYCLSVLSYELL